MEGHPRRLEFTARRLVVLILGVGLMTAATAAAQPTEPGRAGTSPCLTATTTPSDAGRPLTLTFFGVSTLMFDDDHDRILVDGFFSRPGVLRSLVLPIAPIPSRIDAGLGEGPPRVRALLVAHAHHDHALDVAAIAARETDALVIGTPSVIALAKARGVPPERLCHRADRERFDFGEFTVRALVSSHGPSLPVIGPMIDRSLDRPPQGPAHFTRFTDDENLSFFITYGDERRILVHPSAGTTDLRSLNPDIVFIGMGRVGTMTNPEADAYFFNVVGATASLIVPIHWDAFTTSPDEPLRASPWPLDNVGKGFSHLCRFAETRVSVVVLKPQMRSALVVEPDGSWGTQGEWATLCGQDDG